MKRKLTQEEHQRIADFLRFINEDGPEVWNLLMIRYPVKSRQYRLFQAAINKINELKSTVADSCYEDVSPEFENKAYKDMGCWFIT